MVLVLGATHPTVGPCRGTVGDPDNCRLPGYYFFRKLSPTVLSTLVTLGLEVMLVPAPWPLGKTVERGKVFPKIKIKK